MRAVVVLGCKLVLDTDKRYIPGDILSMRLDTAARVYEEGNYDMIIVSGGKANVYEGTSEAMAMKDYLVKLGISEENIIMEQASVSTAENTMFTLEIVGNIGACSLAVVTSNFHITRSSMLFEAKAPRSLQLSYHSSPCPEKAYAKCIQREKKTLLYML